MDPTDYQQAIKDIESSGNYGALGPLTSSGDRAYGAYQVMGSNIPGWTEKHYGKRLTPAEFLADKEAQDAVFNGEFGSYLNKYGNHNDAASMWFSGRPMAAAGNSSDGYNTVPQYVAKFNKALGNPVSAINAAAGIKPSTRGALAFAPEGDDEEETAALSQPGALSKGGLRTLIAGDKSKNKMDTIAEGLTGIGASLAGISKPGQAYALTNQLAQMKKDNESKYKVQVAKDGTIYRIDPESGEVMVGNQPPPVKDIPMLGDARKEGEEYLNSLDPVSRKIIEGWHDGTGIQPNGMSVNKDRMQQLQSAFLKAFPDADFTKLKERAVQAADLARSAAGAGGGIVKNSNTAAQNLNNLADNYIKLHNSEGVGPAAVAHGMNTVSNWMASPERAAAIKALQATGSDASGEITKVLTGGPGGVHEREARATRLANEAYTPQEAAGVLEAEMKDLAGKHKETVDNVRNTMGQRYLDRHPEIEQNFKDHEAALREKVAQLRMSKKADSGGPNQADLFKFLPIGK